ncbi:MAG: hypothetical protein KKG78_12605 [Alphaproteobacteria bacterium]|nr:hypothetical protein [Alphaproteobacteria bacterium]
MTAQQIATRDDQNQIDFARKFARGNNARPLPGKTAKKYRDTAEELSKHASDCRTAC